MADSDVGWYVRPSGTASVPWPEHCAGALLGRLPGGLPVCGSWRVTCRFGKELTKELTTKANGGGS